MQAEQFGIEGFSRGLCVEEPAFQSCDGEGEEGQREGGSDGREGPGRGEGGRVISNWTHTTETPREGSEKDGHTGQS